MARKSKTTLVLNATVVGRVKVYLGDEAQECFRKYPTVAASYRDHSVFLQKARYANLFELAITDYKMGKRIKKGRLCRQPQLS